MYRSKSLSKTIFRKTVFINRIMDIKIIRLDVLNGAAVSMNLYIRPVVLP